MMDRHNRGRLNKTATAGIEAFRFRAARGTWQGYADCKKEHRVYVTRDDNAIVWWEDFC